MLVRQSGTRLFKVPLVGCDNKNIFKVDVGNQRRMLMFNETASLVAINIKVYAIIGCIMRL
jgi:hypothetical protein